MVKKRFLFFFKKYLVNIFKFHFFLFLELKFNNINGIINYPPIQADIYIKNINKYVFCFFCKIITNKSQYCKINE